MPERGAARVALPAQPGTLIGRDGLLADIGDHLLRPNVRLLTLTGPGGSGKTRLAMTSAADLADRFELGACCVELAAIRGPLLVLPTVARALGLAESPSRSPYQALVNFIADRTLLLVLDNFEQVIDAAVDVARLLSDCPRLTVLATSRAALRIRWENELPVPPLELPDLNHLPRLAELNRVPAVALFVERARAVRPDLVLDLDLDLDKTVGRAVAEICVRLDGLPLALELAAARVKLLPPAALLARLVRRIDVLGPAGQDVPARQRTLGATMDWSYDLLTPADQAAFRRLSVFEGGFSVEAADAVLGPELELILDRLASLVDKSLLRPASATAGSDAEPRFHMLETIRQYGLDQLAAAGELERTRDQHAAVCLALAESAAPALGGSSQIQSLDRIEREHANMRAALSWLLAQRGPALRLAGALWRFWEVRGYLAEGRQWLQRALDADDGTQPAARADALVGAGTLASRQAEYSSATDFFEQALALFVRCGDRPGEALALQQLGVQAQMQSDFARAATLFEKGLALFRALGDNRGISLSLNNLGYMLWRQGDIDTAAVLHEQSATIARTLDDRRLTAVPVYNLGVLARFRREYGRAAALLGEALGLFRELGDKRWIAFSLSDLGDSAEQEGDLVRAAHLEREALALFADLGDRFGQALTCERLARVHARLGHQPELAVRVFAVADLLRAAIKSPRPPGEGDDAKYFAELESRLGASTFAAVWAEARARGPEPVISQALAIEPQPEPPHGSVPLGTPTARPLAPGRPLSEREREVAVLIARGLTNRQIGEKLVLSARTVDAHVDHIRSKLKVRARAQIAAWVTDPGLNRFQG